MVFRDNETPRRTCQAIEYFEEVDNAEDVPVIEAREQLRLAKSQA